MINRCDTCKWWNKKWCKGEKSDDGYCTNDSFKYTPFQMSDARINSTWNCWTPKDAPENLEEIKAAFERLSELLSEQRQAQEAFFGSPMWIGGMDKAEDQRCGDCQHWAGVHQNYDFLAACRFQERHFRLGAWGCDCGRWKEKDDKGFAFRGLEWQVGVPLDSHLCGRCKHWGIKAGAGPCHKQMGLFRGMKDVCDCGLWEAKDRTFTRCEESDCSSPACGHCAHFTVKDQHDVIQCLCGSGLWNPYLQARCKPKERCCVDCRHWHRVSGEPGGECLKQESCTLADNICEIGRWQPERRKK